MILRCSKILITKNNRDTEEAINANICQEILMSVVSLTEMAVNIFHTWPNVIAYELVGLAVIVDAIHAMVGPMIRYVNLKTGAPSTMFDLWVQQW